MTLFKHLLLCILLDISLSHRQLTFCDIRRAAQQRQVLFFNIQPGLDVSSSLSRPAVCCPLNRDISCYIDKEILNWQQSRGGGGGRGGHAFFPSLIRCYGYLCPALYILSGAGRLNEAMFVVGDMALDVEVWFFASKDGSRAKKIVVVFVFRSMVQGENLSLGPDLRTVHISEGLAHNLYDGKERGSAGYSADVM